MAAKFWVSFREIQCALAYLGLTFSVFEGNINTKVSPFMFHVEQ